jgi:hypothetical protein
MTLSIVIPAHNEEQAIGPTGEALYKVLTAASVPHEILVVEDHSADGTTAAIRRTKWLSRGDDKRVMAEVPIVPGSTKSGAVVRWVSFLIRYYCQRASARLPATVRRYNKWFLRQPAGAREGSLMRTAGSEQT